MRLLVFTNYFTTRSTSNALPYRKINFTGHELHVTVAIERMHTTNVFAMRGNVVAEPTPPIEVSLAMRQTSSAINLTVVRTTNVVVHRVPRGTIENAVATR